MSRKNKQRSAVLTAPDLTAQVERSISKGNYKQAVHDAKELFRNEQSPSAHQVLERATLLRARQLFQSGLRTDARVVARHLLELGITDDNLKSQAAELFVGVGLFEQSLSLSGSDGNGAPPAELLIHAADHAVRFPDTVDVKRHPEIAEGAGRIRASLEALERGEEAAALERCKAFPRNSPFADWKLFVRGLAAYYRHDRADMQANWQRLDPARPASKIAEVLHAVDAGQTATTCGPSLAPALRRLAFITGAQDIPMWLKSLRGFLADESWADLLATVRRLHESMFRLDGALWQRLTGLIYGQLVHAAASESRAGRFPAWIEQVLKVLTPLPIDPQWKRFHALTAKEAKCDMEIVGAKWVEYLESLDSAATMSESERTIAKALVWEHIANETMSYLDNLEDDDEEEFFEDATSIERLRNRAIECFDKSFDLYPDRMETSRLRLRALIILERPQQATAALGEAIRRFPEEISFLRVHVDQCMRNGCPLAAMDSVAKLRKLKPLDSSIRELEGQWNIACAREHSLAKRWEEGREAFARAETLDPRLSENYSALAKRSLLEQKAKQPEQAAEYQRKAESLLGEPAPLLFCLAIEARRFQLFKKDWAQYDRSLKAALDAKVNAETAAELANLAKTYRQAGITYDGQDKHIRLVVKYIGRTATGAKYSEPTLRTVCEFLEEIDEKKLLTKMVNKGIRSFKDNPYFLYRKACAEIDRGPYKCKTYVAMRDLEKALAMVEKSSDPRDAELLPKIRERISFLENVGFNPFGMPDFFEDLFDMD